MFGLALISVMWAYDGFADLTFASGEVKDPQRNLPRAIIIGTVLIIAIYLLANAAYLYVSPIEKMATSPLIAADTMGALFGQAGVSFIAVIVMISTFGSLMGSMLASPRIFFAMADDKLLFAPIARVHPTWNTPHVAITLATVLGVAMVMTQTFEQLTDTFVLAMWPFYALSVAAIYTLRKSQPKLNRPYKVVGYPFVPAVFIAAAIYLVGNALYQDPVWTGITFGVVLLGLPGLLLVVPNEGSSRRFHTVVPRSLIGPGLVAAVEGITDVARYCWPIVITTSMASPDSTSIPASTLVRPRMIERTFQPEGSPSTRRRCVP